MPYHARFKDGDPFGMLRSLYHHARMPSGSRQDSLCPSPVKVRRVGVLLTDRADDSGFPLCTCLVVWGSALARLGWTLAPVVSCTGPRQTLSWPQESRWTGAGPRASLPGRFHFIEQKRIEDIVGLAAMAPVVAGARLGENADAAPGPSAA